MRVFIDESGSFSWSRPGWSIVAAVGLCELDGTLDAVLTRFREWERSLPAERRASSGEIKASALTDHELATFVWDVLPRKRQLAHVTFCGFDSRETSREVAARFRELLVRDGTRKDRHRHASAKNQRMVQAVDETQAWIRRRSDEDIGWMLALQTAIGAALHHSVIALLDDKHDDGRELAELSFVIDRSRRIRDRRQEQVWRSILNSFLCARSRREPFPLVRQWPADHAFLVKYTHGTNLDLSELWRSITFADSQQTPGVRIADLVAHIAYRHFTRDDAQSAWRRLQPIILGERGAVLHAVEPDVSPSGSEER